MRTGPRNFTTTTATRLSGANLASTPEFAAVKEALQKWLPKHDEPRNPNINGKGDD